MSLEIRAALPSDEPQLLNLARHLNSVNLPADQVAIARLLQRSEESFRADLPPALRKFIFILSDTASGRAFGTSSIVALHGRPDAPYIYFDVYTEEKYSRDLTLHFEHQVLRLGFSYNGPTELAGLVVDPAFRNDPRRLGLLVSYVRFLFIAAQRPLFQATLLAELLPPLEPDGTSHLWDALGKRFTNMTYREADRLSHENKDFIRDLFPAQPVYANLLSDSAQSVIGKVGHQTRGVEKMLRRIGFEYAERVDPFDGGPHFQAPTDQVSVIRQYRSLPWQVHVQPTTPALVARITQSAPYLVARPMLVALSQTSIGISEHDAASLGASAAQVLHCVPLPLHAPTTR
jgi:arginine N-succinyltransferase